MKTTQVTIVWSSKNRHTGLVYHKSKVIGRLNGSAWCRTEHRYFSWTIEYTAGLSGTIKPIPSIGMTRFDQDTLPSACAIMLFHYLSSLSLIIIQCTEQEPGQEE